MGDRHYDIASLAGQIDELLGLVMWVQGELLYKKEGFVLESVSDSNPLSIGLLGVELGEIIPNVPCYVGGKYLYRDDALVHGLLQVEGDRVVLIDVDYIKICRGDEEFLIERGRDA